MKKIILIIAVLIIAGGGLFLWNKTKETNKYYNEIIELSDRASYLTATKTLKRKVAIPLEQMILDAEKDGMCLVVASGYRTREQQQLLYNSDTEGLVARPGTSEHELGIAVDFLGCPMIDGVRNDEGQRLELRDDFSTLPEYQWLKDHAIEYGFEQSYTAENTKETGIPVEEWHWRYIK